MTSWSNEGEARTIARGDDANYVWLFGICVVASAGVGWWVQGDLFGVAIGGLMVGPVVAIALAVGLKI